ncbi:serine/threonine-protein kinase [Rhodococcus erythropolis]|uniref:serine/threonine-protein kinase n=1 Tax=Rhodococcus erythropolis TaxID=1833 RepID=UPI0030132E95
MDLSAFPAGTTINDRYELSRRLGNGAGGSVYEAHDRHLDTCIAVKLLNPLDGGTSGPWQEAQLLEKLKSRYLLPVLNADVVIASDLRFIVTPVLSGGDLERLAGPYGLPPSTAAHYIQQVASGLDRIHRAGMVHRDVKPGNVFVEGDAVVLGDLGFCHLLDDGAAPPNGSFCTVAPEVLPDDGECSPATDVYSLAATAFYLLSGEYPVDHRLPLPEQKARILAGSIRELRTIAPHTSRSVGTVVRKSLNADPTKRHMNATDFGTALAGAVQGCRDWHRVTTHRGHVHCMAGACLGQKKEILVCCTQIDSRSIEVRARIAETGRRIPGRPDVRVTPGQLATTLQRLTASL